MKLVGFNGSPREHGNTSILMNIVADEVRKEGIETEIIQIGNKPLRGCIACYRCFERKNRRCAVNSDEMNDYIAKAAKADAILLGSPVYVSDITTSMKALIERCGFVGRANAGMLRRKVGAAVLSERRAGAIHAFDSLNLFFLIHEMIVPGSTYWNLGIGRSPGEVLQDQEGIATMKVLGCNIAWLLKLINDQKKQT